MKLESKLGKNKLFLILASCRRVASNAHLITEVKQLEISRRQVLNLQNQAPLLVFLDFSFLKINLRFFIFQVLLMLAKKLYGSVK